MRISDWSSDVCSSDLRHGCDSPGTCPAPKSPNSPERWYFCAEHAAEYNKNWDYFLGLNAEEAAKREADERRDAGGVRDSGSYDLGGPGGGSRTSDEMRAVGLLGHDMRADCEAGKQCWQRLLTENTTEDNPG